MTFIPRYVVLRTLDITGIQLTDTTWSRIYELLLCLRAPALQEVILRIKITYYYMASLVVDALSASPLDEYFATEYPKLNQLRLIFSSNVVKQSPVAREALKDNVVARLGRLQAARKLNVQFHRVLQVRCRGFSSRGTVGLIMRQLRCSSNATHTSCVLR